MVFMQYISIMRVLVCGGRDFNDIDFMTQHIMEFHEAVPITVLIAGGAKGVDTIAECWADEMGIEKEIYPISQSDWNKYGKSAGPRRNERMLNAEPDLVMAFPGGNGTAHMAKISLEVPWIEVWQSHYILFKKEDIDYGFLSNFAEGLSFVDDDGLVWDTTEHYYQAHKSPLEKERGYVQMTSSPRKAKERGREIQITKDWEEGRKIGDRGSGLTAPSH